MAKNLISLLRRFGALLQKAEGKPHPKRPEYPGEKDRFSYQRLYHQFDIEPNARVLDVGSGGYPFPYATVLCDRFLERSVHRRMDLAKDSRPLVVGDITDLPFMDKSIDFLYCSHLLEHVDHPIDCCKELMRVAKAGYIETPTFAKDILFSWAKEMHKWHVTTIREWLVFFQYTDRQAAGIRSPAWRNLIFSSTYNELQSAFYNNQDLFHTMLAWKDNFNVMVFPVDSEPQILITKGRFSLLEKVVQPSHSLYAQSKS
jgi:SAM-dependent methyltransferase